MKAWLVVLLLASMLCVTSADSSSSSSEEHECNERVYRVMDKVECLRERLIECKSLEPIVEFPLDSPA